MWECVRGKYKSNGMYLKMSMGDSDEGGFRRRDVLKTVGLAGLLGAASDVTIAEPSREPGPRPNELLVGMESGVSQSTVESSV
jgi:serine protease